MPHWVLAILVFLNLIIDMLWDCLLLDPFFSNERFQTFCWQMYLNLILLRKHFFFFFFWSGAIIMLSVLLGRNTNKWLSNHFFKSMTFFFLFFFLSVFFYLGKCKICRLMMGKETVLLKQNMKGKCKVKVWMLIFIFFPMKFFFFCIFN